MGVNLKADAGTRSALLARAVSIDTVDVMPGFNAPSGFGTSMIVV